MPDPSFERAREEEGMKICVSPLEKTIFATSRVEESVSKGRGKLPREKSCGRSLDAFL